jgi:hypothetical protein
MPEKELTDSALAFVLVNSPRLPDKDLILQVLRDQVGDGVVPSRAQWEDQNLVIKLADATMAISLMPAPYPWQGLEGPCATAFHWKDATECLKSHRFHIVNGVIGGSFSPIERRVVLTHIVRAVAQTSDAIGIYWAEGRIVHEAQAFINDSADVANDEFRPHLWLDVRVEQNPDGTFRCFTTGMAPLGHVEIEVERTTLPPDQLHQFMTDTASYIVSKNVHVGDGKKLTRSAGEKFKVSHSPSMFGRGTVLMVEMP